MFEKKDRSRRIRTYSALHNAKIYSSEKNSNNINDTVILHIYYLQDL